MYRIEQLWVFCVEDPSGSFEGVAGVQNGPMMMPLICSDESLLPRLRQQAQEVVNQVGGRIRIKKFTTMTVVDEITPQNTKNRACGLRAVPELEWESDEAYRARQEKPS